jgi:RNA polymerase subunit RPABC4/transcription elongation factor Spt4
MQSECPVCAEQIPASSEVCPVCAEPTNFYGITGLDADDTGIECPVCAEVISFDSDVCPVCSEATGFGEAVPAGGIECPVCAEVIEPSCDMCPVCAEPTGFTDMGFVDDSMECPVCAENIPSASQVCPVCAEPLEMEAPVPQTTAPATTVAAMPPSHSEHNEVMSADDETWDLVKDSSNVADIEYYLENYPNGKYSVPAKLKLRQLSR